MNQARFKGFVATLLALLLSVVVVSLIVVFIGDNPLHVFDVLISSSLGSFRGLAYTLFYSTPLIFTGLSVALCFHCGMFNIGAEGQLYIGAFAVAAFGILFPELPFFIGIPLGILASFLFGAFWGWIPGQLKARRGSHEVIVTMMMNFVAIGVTSYLTQNFFRTVTSQSPETKPVGAGWQIPTFHQLFSPLGIQSFHGTPFNLSFLLAILCCFLVWWFLWRSKWGFELRSVGQNPSAAQYAGIRVNTSIVLALALAGGLAGLVGVNEVMGNAHRFQEGFSPEYGFLGIAVALLGRNRPMGVFMAALLFGALHRGAQALDIDTEKVTRDLAMVIQATVIIGVASEKKLRKFRIPAWGRFRKRPVTNLEGAKEKS
jgi:simple sugar transport system permease protein